MGCEDEGRIEVSLDSVWWKALVLVEGSAAREWVNKLGKYVWIKWSVD
jgi:hypothetical protein